MSEGGTSTWAVDWVGAWLISTASRPHTILVFNSPELNFNAALMQPVPPLWPVYFLIMAPSTRLIYIPPWRSSPSFAAIENHSRTILGIRWAPVRSVNFRLELQASHCHTCKFARYFSFALPFAHLGAEAKPVLILFYLHSLIGHPDLPVLLVMPKLRQRMSCRTGNSRRQTSCQASSSTTDSSTLCSDFRMDRYPATRSGWGRGRILHNLAASSFNSATNTARLQFPYIHGNFSFMASITIELNEINAGQEAAPFGVATERLVEDRSSTIQMNYEQSKASGSGKSMAP